MEFGGVLIISLFCGLVMTLILEMPFMKLQKKLMSLTKEKMKQKIIVDKVKQIKKT